VVGADGHDVAGAEFADTSPQVKAPVNFVAGGKGGADAAVMRLPKQPAGQFRLGREHDLVWYPGQLAALLVGRPVRGQVQGPADQGMPGRDRIRQGDRDLAQGDAPGGAAVLAGRADAVGGGLLIGGLIHDQDRVAAGPGLFSVQLLDRPVRSCVQHRPVIAAGAGQQVLHPARAVVPGSLGEGPAVVIVEFRQQAVHHTTAGRPRLPAGEARSDPRHQVIEQASVPVMVYRGSSGCRVIVVFHKPA
jgi:hypothetical protein